MYTTTLHSNINIQSAQIGTDTPAHKDLTRQPVKITQTIFTTKDALQPYSCPSDKEKKLQRLLVASLFTVFRLGKPESYDMGNETLQNTRLLLQVRWKDLATPNRQKCRHFSGWF